MALTAVITRYEADSEVHVRAGLVSRTKYTMRVIYDAGAGQWWLVFNPHDEEHLSEQYKCRDFVDAKKRFITNCQYYGIETPYIPKTEEEFFDIPGGVLGPAPKVARSHTSKTPTVNKMLSGGYVW